MSAPPRFVWETPCLTYVEERLAGARWRSGCLWHRTTGPDRTTEAEAEADCRRHMQAQHNQMHSLPGV